MTDVKVLAAKEGADQSTALPLWAQLLLTVALAAIPAVISWLVSRQDRELTKASAEQASLDAQAARASSEEMERLRRLDQRVREAKVETYLPLIKLMGKMFDGPLDAKSPAERARLDQSLRDAMANSWSLGLIYSSDRVQRAFGRMMQGTFAAAPISIVLRLFSEFILAARRDLGDDRSQTTATEIWAPKLNDLFGESPIAGFDTLSFAELAARESWSPPWSGTHLEHRDDEELTPPTPSVA